MSQGDLLHVVTGDDIGERRRFIGKVLIWGSFALMAMAFAWCAIAQTGYLAVELSSWRLALYAYLLWATCLCIAQVVLHGEQGKRTLFVLPATLFVVAMVIFPLIFALTLAFSNWNLSAFEGPRFNGLDNVRQMWTDPFYWNALKNMVYYTLAILVEYSIAFGLALIQATQIRARRFFRVAFLMPLMLSPVAVSWMVGKSMLEIRFGPISQLARWLGWDRPSFFGDPEIARLTIMIMDAWTFIPFMMIMLLAGLQAIPREVQEAARVDGASGWRGFWEVTFPLMLPVSLTAILIRIIFKLKLADIIINVTSGGPGGATDSVTSFIFREYRDRSNVGYGTLLAIVYLALIVIAITAFMKAVDRWMNPKY
ncbi:MAG: sugar ABC transporter permease [Rhodobacter sp.]|nr:sugar ABC transporter permease [Rhodobacter sp.]MCY4167301.1 sugar ABC transporter permease [Rhodobacter sp.]MCY4240456.1 sugar ABC transporter permease [Rhodobacter sp.]